MKGLKTTTISFLTIGLLAGSAVGVTAQDEEVGAPSLVSEEVEPGVERIISDGAGHDLDERHPSNRYDMDGIAITTDGTVWLTTTYSGSDNDAHPQGPRVWAVGQPGTFSVPEGVPAVGPTSLVAQSDGSLLVIANAVARFDGQAFVPDDGPRARGVPAGTLWLVEPAEMMGLLAEGEIATFPSKPLAAIWNGWMWVTPSEFSRFAETPRHFCWTSGDGVTCEDGLENVTRYLQGTDINQIAAGTDGSIWAVGGFDGENGGLYRISTE